MKERPILFSAPMVRAVLDVRKTQTRRVVKPQPDFISPENVPRITKAPGLHPYIFCPYGQPGDRLWVREAWRVMGNGPKDTLDMFDRDDIQYRADDDQSYIEKYRPSIHMPRKFSRIDLEVTAVRVERLQEISDDDLAAEGIQEVIDAGVDHDGTPRDAYRALWESLNGPGSWDANPWVWVVTFRMTTQ